MMTRKERGGLEENGYLRRAVVNPHLTELEILIRESRKRSV